MGCCISGSIPVGVDRNLQPQDSIFQARQHVGQYPMYSKIMNYALASFLKSWSKGEFSQESIVAARAKMQEMVDGQKGDRVEYLKKKGIYDLVDQTDFDLEVQENVTIKVKVFRPKSLPQSGNPAMVYAHGGFGVLCEYSVDHENMVEYAHDLQCIVFNVDYRLAPEVKGPGGSSDLATAIRHVHENSEQFGVDKSKIVAMGQSAGGYTVMGALRHLIEQDKQDLVKMMILQCPMLSNQMNRIPVEQQWSFEKRYTVLNESAYKCLATDYEKQKAENDPVLYPGYMPDEQLAKLPPTVIFTSEMDFLRRDTIHFTERLKNVGRQLDLLDMPSVTHAYENDKSLPETQWALQEMVKLWKTYVHPDHPIDLSKKKGVEKV